MLATIAFIQLFNCDLTQFLELEPNYEGLSDCFWKMGLKEFWETQLP